MDVHVPDMSYYQYGWDETITKIEQPVNFSMTREHCPGVILRLGQGNFGDKAFTRAWQDSGAAGLLRGIYWFYDPRVDPKRQAEVMVELLGNRTPEMETWADIERLVLGGKEIHGYDNPHNWYDFMERIKSLRPDLKLGVYTGGYYWNERFAPGESRNYWSHYPLWIATYGPAPYIPKPWTVQTYWQFTDHADGRGLYGTHSSRVDMNLFNGTIGDFYSRYNITENPVEESPQIEIIFKENNKVKYASTVLTTSLRGRSGPGQGFDTVTTAPHYTAGTVLTGTELKTLSSQEAWMKVEDSRYPEVWVAYKFNGQYLASVPVEESVPTTISNADVKVEVNTDTKTVVVSLSSLMDGYEVEISR